MSEPAQVKQIIGHTLTVRFLFERGSAQNIIPIEIGEIVATLELRFNVDWYYDGGDGVYTAILKKRRDI